MPLYVNTNVASLNSQRRLYTATNNQSESMRRLSSGKRIINGMDDASGIGIANRKIAQIRGLHQAQRNANDGISILQVADGSLEEVANALQRVRELSVQMSNSSYSTSDRSNAQTEIDQLLSEINRMANEHTFNDMNILDGGYANQQFHIGENQDEVMSITIPSTTISALGLTTIGVSTQANAETAISTIDTALNSLLNIRAELGSKMNRLESAISSLAISEAEMEASRSRFQDLDVASETGNLTSRSIIQQASVSILAQANQQPQMALQLLG
ncbi:flagellin [Magnetofaba australis]|uniref:Flagellin n=1 Tax=Magnetofaba australis IT-1 TaxID=1434232 RepID=A0A1Y2K3G4_9PROT|nr:flagellin [Magnetofaba australis]OSM02502.1 putative flagellin domain-containing protein [Magnetofaba australis IT-1]